MIESIYQETKESMGKSVEALKNELNRLRTGRASLSILDGIKVDYYGTLTPLNQMATLAVPESRLITIQPWDASVIKDLEKAISIMKERLKPEANLLPQVTALDLLRTIHERLSSNTVTLKEIRISPKKVRMTGLTDSFESVEKIRSALEGYECFTEIETGRIQRTADGSQVEFPFTIVVGC